MFENFDLSNVVTPVDTSQLRRLLKEVSYDPTKTEFLIKGFEQGFDP